MTEPTLPPGTNFCYCSPLTGGCGRYFKSVSAFEGHRVGDSGDRRCMAGVELQKAGYEPNPRGYWRVPSDIHGGTV